MLRWKQTYSCTEWVNRMNFFKPFLWQSSVRLADLLHATSQEPKSLPSCGASQWKKGESGWLHMYASSLDTEGISPVHSRPDISSHMALLIVAGLENLAFQGRKGKNGHSWAHSLVSATSIHFLASKNVCYFPSCFLGLSIFLYFHLVGL